MNIPDRVSMDPRSPHFFPLFRKIGVIFDGKVIFNCAEFCVSEGWARRIVTDGRGNFKRERGDLVTVVVKGKVEPYER